MEKIKTFLCKLISFPTKDTQLPGTMLSETEEKSKSFKKRKCSFSDEAVSISKKSRLEDCEARRCHLPNSSLDFYSNWVIEKGLSCLLKFVVFVYIFFLISNRCVCIFNVGD